MTLNVPSLGSTPDLGNPPLPFAARSLPLPCLAARRLIARAVYKRLPTSLARVSQLSSTDHRWRDATRLSVSLSTCFSSQRSISRLSFIFAKSDTDWCELLVEICLSHYYCQVLLGVPFERKTYISFKRVAVILFPRHYTCIQVWFIFLSWILIY